MFQVGDLLLQLDLVEPAKTTRVTNFKHTRDVIGAGDNMTRSRGKLFDDGFCQHLAQCSCRLGEPPSLHLWRMNRVVAHKNFR